VAEHEPPGEPNSPLSRVPHPNRRHAAANGADGQAQEPQWGHSPANLSFELQRRGTGWLAPPQKAMEAALAAAADVPSLQILHVKAAAVEGVAKDVHVPFEDLCRLAEFRIEIECEIGVLLSQTVHPGRPAKLSRDVIITEAGLPPGISPNMSSRCQRLAAIPTEFVKRCFLEARRKGRVPSPEGLLRSAGFKKSPTTKPRTRRKTPSTVDCPSVVADAISRFLKVGTCVGDVAQFASAKKVPAVLKSIEKLRGIVFVADCPDPDEWLPELAQAERKRQVEEVAVLLPAGTAENWFVRIIEGGWQCCFLRGQPARMVAYHGERKHAFWLVMRSLGCVMEAGLHEQAP